MTREQWDELFAKVDDMPVEELGKIIVDSARKAGALQTNADRIRAMTDEELAEWLADILNHCDNKKPEELCRTSCPLYKCCNDQPYDNIEDWLKDPVEEGGNG